MTIALGADHRGFTLKQELLHYLNRLGYKVKDQGTFSAESADYPDFAFAVARAVKSGRVQRGVLVCATGIGMSIAANKVRGVRAALCWNEKMARLARKHNNANVLCLGSDFLKPAPAKKIVRVFLETGFARGRHLRRVKKISAFDFGK